ERRTLELAMTGRVFSAAEAFELTLVHELTEDPVTRAREIAQGLAAASPTAMHSGLSFVQQSRGLDWEKDGGVAPIVREGGFTRDDFLEGLQAYLEKRPARWPSLPPPPPEVE